MIFVIPEKKFMKNKKRLVEVKDYVIMNATEDESGGMSEFSNVVTMDGLNVPPKLVKAVSGDDDDSIDPIKLERLEKKYFKGKSFITSCIACIAGLIEHKNMNIFIVVRNKAFKYYGKTIVKKLNKMGDMKNDIAYLFEDLDDMKKLLRKDLNSGELDELKSRLHKLEKKYIYNDDKKSSDKKDKKKKKKKHKKD